MPATTTLAARPYNAKGMTDVERFDVVAPEDGRILGTVISVESGWVAFRPESDQIRRLPYKTLATAVTAVERAATRREW